MKKLHTIGLFIVLSVLAGSTGVFAKIALRDIPSLSFSFLRFFTALIVLFPFSIKHLPTFNKKDKNIILISLLASLNIILFSFGIKYTTASMSQVIYSAVPIMTAVFSFYIIKEKFGFSKISGIIIGFIGTMSVVLLPLISSKSGGTIFGNIIITIAMISISVYWVFSKRIQEKYSTIKINNYFIFVTTIILALLSISDFFLHPKWWRGVSSDSYIALLFIAIFGTAICYLLNQILIKKTSPVISAMSAYVQPLVAFLLAYQFLSERLTTGFIIGTGISLIGIGIYNYNSKNKEIME